MRNPLRVGMGFWLLSIVVGASTVSTCGSMAIGSVLAFLIMPDDLDLQQLQQER